MVAEEEVVKEVDFVLPATVLIADDDPSVLDILADLLEDDGYEIITACSGHQCLQLATGSVDLLILDVCMPYPDGIEVCRLLRRDQATRQLGILCLSAYSKDDIMASALEVGADDYLEKPVQFSELCVKVRALSRIRQIPPPYRSSAYRVALRREIEKFCVEERHAKGFWAQALEPSGPVK